MSSASDAVLTTGDLQGMRVLFLEEDLFAVQHVFPHLRVLANRLALGCLVNTWSGFDIPE